MNNLSVNVASKHIYTNKDKEKYLKRREQSLRKSLQYEIRKRTETDLDSFDSANDNVALNLNVITNDDVKGDQIYKNIVLSKHISPSNSKERYIKPKVFQENNDIK